MKEKCRQHQKNSTEDDLNMKRLLTNNDSDSCRWFMWSNTKQIQETGGDSTVDGALTLSLQLATGT